MADSAGVSDEQLDQWEHGYKVVAERLGNLSDAPKIVALIGEVRASHAREAELLRDNLVINKATFTRTHPDSHLGHAPSIAYSELEAERDVLQQRIDKALELHQEVSRPAYGGQITDTAGNPVPFAAPYSVSCSCGKPYCTVRAALTGADNQPTEETP